jgi:RNA polymerase sigma-70 factor, ECF subfamily
VTEAQLVARAAAGDPAAERKLYDLHVDRVYRLAYRLAGDGEVARDLTQETFIRAFARLATFRGEAAFGTWLRAIAMSVILNDLRRRRPARMREAPYEEAVAADWLADPRREAEPDLRERLRAAIDALPNRYRTVFVMHDVEGYTHEEIGTALGVQPGTSKAQLSRARAKLRERLAAFAKEWMS